MNPITTPPHPSKDELKATRVPAIVAFSLIVVVALALVVMLTLQIAQVSDFHPATYAAVFFGGCSAVFVTATFGARKKGGK